MSEQLAFLGIVRSCVSTPRSTRTPTSKEWWAAYAMLERGGFAMKDSERFETWIPGAIEIGNPDGSHRYAADHFGRETAAHLVELGWVAIEDHRMQLTVKGVAMAEEFKRQQRPRIRWDQSMFRWGGFDS